MASGITLNDHKNLTVVLSNDSTKLSTAKFSHTDNSDVYYFNGLELYGQAIRDIIHGSKSLVTLVAVFSDLKSLLHLLRFLYEIEIPSTRQQVELSFESSVKRYGGNNGSTTCMGPLAVSLIVAMESSAIEEDPTAVESILYQQVFRSIALVHGGAFVVIDNIENSFNHKHESTVLNALGISSQTPMAAVPNPIFTPDAPNHVCLYIPSGWDSHNKVLLLSKSIYYDPDSSDFKLFTTDTELGHFCTTYINYLQGKVPISEIQKLVQTNYRPRDQSQEQASPKDTHVLTYQDLVNAVHINS